MVQTNKKIRDTVQDKRSSSLSSLSKSPWRSSLDGFFGLQVFDFERSFGTRLGGSKQGWKKRNIISGKQFFVVDLEFVFPTTVQFVQT
jgi:hypothetical protein